MNKFEQLKIDLEMCEAEAICYFCNTQLEYYTTKSGWTYLSNPDRSPHRKSYICCCSWEDYKNTPKIEHRQPIRKRNLKGYTKKMREAITDLPKEYK